jgi:hypothetical protein
MINLIKREIVMQGKGIFWGLFGIIVGLITVYLDRSSTNILTFTYICSIFFLGFTSFIAYKKPALRAESILLPATVQEKYFANLIYEFIIIPITIFITACIAATIGSVISFWLYGNEINLIDIFRIKHLNLSDLFTTLACMSILFFFSLFFKKNSFLKTAVSTFLYFFIISIITITCIWIKQYYFVGHITSVSYNFPLNDKHLYIFYIASSIISLFFLVLTYFRLKEERI